MKRQLNIFLLALAALIIFSCKKGDSYYKNYTLKETVYEGTSLDFLESSNLYDSLLLVLDRVPALRKKLNESEKTTFFAMSNNSFTNALAALNAVRKANNRSSIYLEDIPLEVLDETLYHYLFDGTYTTDDLKNYTEGLEIRSANDYRMHLQYDVTFASGFVDGGQQQIKLSDMNNSIFQRYWQESFTSVVNIRTSNGLVHILAPSHNFGFSKLTSLLAQ